MKTTADMVTVGSEWIHGNSFFPQCEKVTGLLSWDRVPVKFRKTWQTIEYWMKLDGFASRVYVATVDPRGRRNVAPMDVFVGTRYVSHEAMCAAYAQSRKAV